jgi:riboflavin biosynthesis pyrimidine reductase
MSEPLPGSEHPSYSLRKFDILFDNGEASAFDHAAFERYGPLGFPSPPATRPWIYSNFVQSLDGIVSFKGKHASGSDISQSREDRWLMDLLRTFADAVLLGVNTLVEETRAARAKDAQARGPVYRIEDATCCDLRARLKRNRQMNVFVTGAASLNLGEYQVFDGDKVDAVVITTDVGAARLAQLRTHPHVRVLTAGKGTFVDLPVAMRLLHEQLGLRYVLCEGGPTLYGWMARADLIDEKFLTVSPVEVGQAIPTEQEPAEYERESPPKLRPTIFGAPGFTTEQATWWQWLSCRRVGSHQFNRYRRRR